MKNIYSNIHKFNKKILNKAINYLKKNDPIGVPTETVYGLAGNAYSFDSINRIYALKKRPKINPLIVHYYNIKDLSRDAVINDNFLKLYKHLCPGPITFILKKKKNSRISKNVTSNLSTVAVRFPKHKITRQLLNKINFPLAIPSANISSGISPVDPRDVSDEFQKKVKLIIDGGKSQIGIESTVVDLTKKAKILRPGVINSSKISKIIGSKVYTITKSNKIRSPGMMKKHYSPGIPMKLNQVKAMGNHAFIIFGNKYKKNKNTFNLSRTANLNEAAKNLYKTFRKIKKKKYKKIYVVKIPNKDIGIALNDRLKHAAN